MKLTKEQLKEMIKKELKEFDDLSKARSTAGATRKGAIEHGKAAASGSGISDAERGIIQQLLAQFTEAAKSANITGGRVMTVAKQLSKELLKVTGAPAQEQEEQQ